MQSGGVLVGRAKIAHYALSCFYDACHLVSLQTSGSCRSEACRLDRCDGSVVGKAANPTVKLVASPSAIRVGSV